MPYETRVNWPSRQMYSRSAPIGRDQIFAAFAAVLAAATGRASSQPELIAREEIPGMEYVGYYADKQTHRISAGEAALICAIDPILASQGVSGEHHTWWAEGLPAGLGVRGSALSSARQASWAALTIDGVDEAHAAELGRIFAAAFPPVMTAEQLDVEL